MVVRNLLELSKYPLFQCQGDSPKIFFQDNGEGDRCGSIGHPHISILTIDMNRILTPQFSHELTATIATCPNKTKQIKKIPNRPFWKEEAKTVNIFKTIPHPFLPGKCQSKLLRDPTWYLDAIITCLDCCHWKRNNKNKWWWRYIYSHRNVSWFSHYGNQ